MKELETLLRDWYLKKGYCVNETGWFEIHVDLAYHLKVIKVIDLTGKAGNYKFEDKDTDKVFEKVLEFVRGLE